MAIVSTTSTAQAEEFPLKIFVLAGQSNMQGCGASMDLPPGLRQPQKDVLLFRGTIWTPLEPGKSFGPEITFGQAMAQHFGEPIGLVKVAVDGTNLASHWSPENPRSLYVKLVGMVKDARQSRPVVVMGMLWMQGAADARFEPMAQAYQKNLVHLIETARKDFGDANLPFVCGRINQPSQSYPYVDIVRKAQESISLPNYRTFNCDDLTRNGDVLHFDAIAQQELGRRFATAMIELLDKTRKKAP